MQGVDDIEHSMTFGPPRWRSIRASSWAKFDDELTIRPRDMSNVRFADCLIGIKGAHFGTSK